MRSMPTRSRRTIVLLAVVLAMILAPAAQALAANVDYFLKIPDIDGESKDKTHGGEIEVLSWSWGEANPATGTGGTASGAVQWDPIVLAKFIDKASPKLMRVVATGEHLPGAVLTLREDNKHEYLVIDMTDVVITSYQVSGSAGSGDRPTETLSLNFSEVEVVYTERSGVAHTFAWDLVGNVAV
jgi:type VI secretion system secreted protein Hcp